MRTFYVVEKVRCTRCWGNGYIVAALKTGAFGEMDCPKCNGQSFTVKYVPLSEALAELGLLQREEVQQ